MIFNFSTFPILKTNRLNLRSLTFDDAKSIFELRTNSHINKLITRKIPININEASHFIKVCHEEFKNKNRVFWAIEYHTNVVGTLALHRISMEEHYAEIGYELHPSYHQKGLMSEAMGAVLNFGFNTMGLQTIEAFTHKNNKASIALLNKHRFIFEEKRREVGFKNNRIFKITNTDT